MQLGNSDPRSRIQTDSTERAVSPVIGVILMVAITVILAAVIGVFVLGLGDELGESQPTNSLSINGEIDDANGDILDVSINHDSGDAVDVDDLEFVLRYDGATEDSDGTDAIDADSDTQAGDEFSVGDSITLEDGGLSGADTVEEPVTLEVVHTPSDSIVGSDELDVQD